MSDVNERGRIEISRFLDSIDEWTVRVLEDVRDEQVKEIFQDCVCVGVSGRTSHSGSNRLPKKIKTAIVDDTPKIVRDELAEALNEGRFDEKFQILHELKDKYKDRTTNAWRPPYDAADHMRNARVQLKESHLKQLKFLISITKSSIAGFKDKIRAASVTTSTIPDMIKQTEASIESAERKSSEFTEKVTSLNDQLCEAMDNNPPK